MLAALAFTAAFAPSAEDLFNASAFDVAGLVRDADVTGDGKLNFEEFKKVSLGWAGCGELLGGGTRCRGGRGGDAGAFAVAPRAPPPWRACGLRPVTAQSNPN